MQLRGLYRRWRTLLGEAWRFGLVGGINVVINFVVFNALVIVLFAGSELKANVVATTVATTTSYLMNRGWTFRHRRTSRIPREYVLYFTFNALALGIELAVMGAAKYGLGLTALWALNLAKVLGLGLGTVFRFWTYRSFVFAGQPAETPTHPAGRSADGTIPAERSADTAIPVGRSADSAVPTGSDPDADTAAGPTADTTAPTSPAPGGVPGVAPAPGPVPAPAPEPVVTPVTPAAAVASTRPLTTGPVPAAAE